MFYEERLKLLSVLQKTKHKKLNDNKINMLDLFQQSK